MALSEVDRALLERCLARKPRAWEDFVDRFMGLVMHVVNHTAQTRSIRITPEDREDLVAQVFLGLVRDDMVVLRHFRGQSSLATYLTVVARRIVVHEILKRRPPARLSDSDALQKADAAAAANAEQRAANRDEIERLLGQLNDTEAQVVRMYHLEGRTYQEISARIGMPENSIGPTLSRARQKMRLADGHSAA